MSFKDWFANWYDGEPINDPLKKEKEMEQEKKVLAEKIAELDKALAVETEKKDEKFVQVNIDLSEEELKVKEPDEVQAKPVTPKRPM